ncbi:hypothetical protein SNE40_008526 [Patella caerulea]|uniref:Uncharacterized protein n=1 Tax=Patella caerulea TaxID=87958 RepID=A0AAN8JVQ3_PATCE
MNCSIDELIIGVIKGSNSPRQLITRCVGKGSKEHVFGADNFIIFETVSAFIGSKQMKRRLVNKSSVASLLGQCAVAKLSRMTAILFMKK